MNSITLHQDPKTHVITLLRGGHGKDTILELDSSGNIELTDEVLKAKDVDIIDQYEYEIAETLSEEQQTILYISWGKALSIMISRTANVVGIDKRLAKEIITQGERYGILYQGNNNTWKVSDPSIIKPRWLDKGKGIQKESKPEKDMSIKGIMGRYAEKAKELGIIGFERPIKGEGGMIVEEVVKHENVKRESKIESSVEILPEEPLKKVNIQALRDKLAKAQKQYDDPSRIDTGACNTFTLIDEMKVLKVQITNAEIQENKKQYDVEVSTYRPGIINLTQKREQTQLGIQDREPSDRSIKKVLTKKKPSPLKSVRKR